MLLRRAVSLFALVVFSAGFSAFSQTQAPDQQAIRVSGNPRFSQPRAVLGLLAARKGKAKRNNFCVIGYRYADGNESAWVYWREGKAIILWEPVADGVADLTQSRRYLRLSQDVAANEAELKASTYLVTRQWVNSLLRDCQANGEKFVVKR